MIDKANTILLGLDVSTRCTGYGVMNMAGELIDAGALKATGSIEEKMVSLRSNLQELLKKFEPTFIAIEQLNCPRNMKTTRLLAEFIGVVRLTCYEYNENDIRFYVPSQLKAIVGVNGIAMKKMGAKRDAIKEAVVTAVEKKFGIQIPRDKDKSQQDAADAVTAAIKLYEQVRYEQANQRQVEFHMDKRPRRILGSRIKRTFPWPDTKGEIFNVNPEDKIMPEKHEVKVVTDVLKSREDKS